MSGHSLKLQFCMFERSQVKHNSLDCHNFFGIYFPLIAKFTCSKLNTNSKIFLHVQSIQTSRVDNPCFFKCLSFHQMCTIPFENWGGF